MSDLDRYRDLPEGALDASTRRALQIADQWDDLADQRDVVSTAHGTLVKHHPARLKRRLGGREDGVAWIQIYRAMRRLAEVSDRYQYVERPRRDDEPRTGTVRELHRTRVATDGGDRP